MTKRIRVGILCGGKSAEHEVSLQSAKSIVEAIDRNKYEVLIIGLDKEGKWRRHDPDGFLKNAENPTQIGLSPSAARLAFVPGEKEQFLLDLNTGKSLGGLDVVFPVLHGPFGEDGTIQGLLKLLDVPFVGPGVLGSAVGMDKDVAKRLFRDAGIPVADYLMVERSSAGHVDFGRAREALGLPFYVKPANLGSSVGVRRVSDGKDFQTAVDEALSYDNKIILEENIPGREIECSVLGNENPIASLPGEVIPNTDKHAFYSYEAKYVDETGAHLKIPVDLPQDTIRRIQELAVKSFKVLCCEGMARADFFLKEDQEIVVNELNTIPGFTKISMYPKLWEVSGIPYGELVDRLIRLAMDRYECEKRLQTSFLP